MMEIRAAKLNEAVEIFDLIKARIAWMDQKGISQWNNTGYLEAYPLEYFMEQCAAGNFYIAVMNGQIVGAFAMFETDERWPDGLRAVHIHQLVSDPNVPHVGSKLLQFAKDLAVQLGLNRVRLDCQQGNERLNAYYEAQGFALKGECSEGPYYQGYLREWVSGK